jgi:transcriptional regulator with XRE-family HTH domain
MEQKNEDGLEAEIHRAIKRSGRSLHDLARDSGLDAGQLSRFVRGKRSLILRQASKLCKALGLKLVAEGEPVPSPRSKRKGE